MSGDNHVDYEAQLLLLVDTGTPKNQRFAGYALAIAILAGGVIIRRWDVATVGALGVVGTKLCGRTVHAFLIDPTTCELVWRETRDGRVKKEMRTPLREIREFAAVYPGRQRCIDQGTIVARRADGETIGLMSGFGADDDARRCNEILQQFRTDHPDAAPQVRPAVIDYSTPGTEVLVTRLGSGTGDGDDALVGKRLEDTFFGGGGG